MCEHNSIIVRVIGHATGLQMSIANTLPDTFPGLVHQ